MTETLIHITDHQTDEILDTISETDYWSDIHYKTKQGNIETFQFISFGDKPFTQFLTKRNRLVIPDEDNKLIEFFIINVNKLHNCEVLATATYVTLKTAKIIRPHTTGSLSAEAHAIEALASTEWEIGTVDFNGTRTITFDDYSNPYAYLNKIASEFGLELHFRVESNGNRIVRRYVDLVEKYGNWQGREIEFGKDLQGIERREDTSNIVTALLGLGPIQDDGARLEVLVEDQDALQRWGRNGQHIIEPYEPQFTNQDVTEDRIRTLTQNELNKRINSIVEYHADVVDLENIEGLEHEKFRFGDTIRIKDLKFSPPLYLEARVHSVSRSIKNKGRKVVELGDFIEYTEEEINVIWKSLQQQIKLKASLSQLIEYAEKVIPEQPNAPDPNEHPKWVDTSGEVPELKLWKDDIGEWTTVKGEKGDPGPNIVNKDTTFGDKWLVASYIESLNGLNIGNGQFVVDEAGDVGFAGHLEGASGTFSGNLESSYIVVGPKDPTVPTLDDGLVSVEFKMPERVTESSYIWATPVRFEFINGTMTVKGQGALKIASLIDADHMLTPRVTTRNIFSQYNSVSGSMLTDHQNGNVSVNAVGGNLFLGLNTTNSIRVNPTTIFFNSGPSIDMSSGSARWKQSNNNYILQNDLGNVFFYINGAQRHAFYGDGTKTGGTFEFEDGEILGMSPTDSPQTLIEYIEFDIPLTENGTKIYLDERYRKAIHHFAVFPNNGKVIEKGYDYFIISGEGLADIRIVGERLGEEGKFWVDMRSDNNGEAHIDTTAKD